MSKEQITLLTVNTDTEDHEEHDAFDSYFECITSCSWVGGEDAECVTRCVEVHLKDETPD